MQTRTVESVMTRDVVSVPPDATFKHVATLLADNNISAVPVTDVQGRVIGVVSEADLLRRLQSPPPLRRATPRFPRMRTEPRTAADVMTTPAVTVGANATIVSAAQLFAARGFRRLPVVDTAGHLLGIVSRHDLIRVFTRADDDIAAEIRDDVLPHELLIDPATVEVRVHDGIVTLSGEVSRASLALVTGALVDRVDGVVGVVNQISFHLDDSRPEHGIVSRSSHGHHAGGVRTR